MSDIRRAFRTSPLLTLSKVLSHDIRRHFLKEFYFSFLETVCTYGMRQFGALCLLLQKPSDSMPKFLQFVSILIGFPFFKASHLCFKLAYALKRRRLHRVCSEDFFLEFYDRS